MDDILEYMRECQDDLKKYFIEKHVKQIKELLIKTNSMSEIQSYFDRLNKKTEGKPAVMEMFRHIQKIKKANKGEIVPKMIRVISIIMAHNRHNLLAESFVAIQKYEPEEQIVIDAHHKTIGESVNNIVRVSFVLKLSENGSIPTNIIKIIKKGSICQQLKRSTIDRYLMCEFQVALKPFQQFKFQTQGNNQKQVWLSNVFQAKIDKNRQIILTGVKFKYYKLDLFKRSMFTQMDLIEEVLALSLMIQSDSVALLHEGLSDRYEELAKEAYDWRETVDLEMLRRLNISKSSYRTYYYTLAWLHKNQLQMNTNGNDSRIFPFLANNLPQINYPSHEKLQNYEIILLRLIIKAIFYGERRQYLSMKLGQAINRLIRFDAECLSFVIKLFEQQSLKNNTSSLMKNISFQEIEQLIFVGKESVLKNITNYMTMLYYKQARRLSIAHYILILAKIQHQIKSLKKLSEGHSQSIKYYKIITTINDMTFSNGGAFYITKFDEFIGLWDGLIGLPSEIQDWYAKKSLLDILESFITSELCIKSPTAIKLLHHVFVRNYYAKFFDINHFESWAERFFTSEVTSSRITMFGYHERLVTRNFSYISQSLLQSFIVDVYQPLVCSHILHKNSPLPKYLYNALGLHYFNDACMILNNSILPRSIEVMYQHFKVLVINLYARGIEQRKLRYDDMIRSKSWLFIVKLNSWLREILLDLFIQGVKAANKPDVKLTENLIDSLYDIDDNSLSQELKDSLMLRLFNATNISHVSAQDIREILFRSPGQARIYTRLARTGSEQVRFSLSQSLSRVKDQIEQEKISYKNLKHIEQYNQTTWRYLSELFSFCDGSKLKVIVQRLTQKCEEFLQRVGKYEALFSKFSEVNSLVPLKQSCRDILYNFKLSHQITFTIPGMNSVIINKQVLECYDLKVFKQLLKVKGTESIHQFTELLNKAMDQLVMKVTNCFTSLNNKTLTLAVIEQMFRGLTIYDTAAVLNINKQANVEHSSAIQAIYSRLLSVPTISQIHQGLMELSQRFEDMTHIETLATLSGFIIMITSNRLIDVNAVQFSRQVQNFEQLLKKLALSVQLKEQTTRVIWLVKQCPQVWQMMERVKKDDIEELKEYINEQEEGFINSRNVIQIQCVHRFYYSVLKVSKNLQEFVGMLKTFIEDESKKGFDSLADSIDSCNVHRATLEQKLSEVKHREASFKFSVLDIMTSSDAIISHNEQSQAKELRIQQSDIRLSQQRIYTKRQLNEFRDKSLLVINSLKRNKQEDFGILDEEIDTLRAYVLLYEQLESILELYEKLLNLGYPNNFIFDTKQQRFSIHDNNFEKVADYVETLSVQCRQWQILIKEVYEESFGFCHFQSRQLKRIIGSLTRLELDPALYQIFEVLSKDTFAIFLQTRGKELYNKMQVIKDPVLQLEFVREFFGYFDIRNQPMLAPQRRLNINSPIIIKMTVCQEASMYQTILTTLSDRERSISQMLFCKSTTTKYEVETFLLRSLLDHKNRVYIVLQASMLPTRIQLHFQQLLEQYLSNEKLAPRLKKMRLLMIENQLSNQRIFSFLQNHKSYQLLRDEMTAEQLSLYKPKTQNIFIVQSVRAGYGKTFWIQQHAKEYKINNLKYIPLCGSVDMARVVERVKLALFTKKALDQSNKIALVIQVHNVKNKLVLDQILLQIVFFNSLYCEGFHYLPEQLTVYIQIQNISNEFQLKDYRTLYLFRGSDAIVTVKTPTPKVVKLYNSSMNTMFAMQYLRMLKSSMIDKQQLTYEQFIVKEHKITDIEISQLLNEYFFEPLNDYHPSFVQLQSFLQLLFEAFKVFSKSIYYAVATIQEYHQNFKQAGFDKYRSSYIKILIENARGFLIRTVNEGQLAEIMSGKFHQILRDFPFLIVSNSDQTTYSFVYLDHKQVPLIIKKYILIQSNLLKGNKVNDKLFIEDAFSKESLSFLKGEFQAYRMFQMLTQITNSDDIIPSDDYSITLDNFFKMCLIIQRIKSKVPVVIMGETGVGKTALIRFLAVNIYHDQLMCINVHAGTNEKVLIAKFQEIRTVSRLLLLEKRRLWVFFDQFNTTDDVGYINELIMDRRFLGQPLDCQNVVFLAACNPFRNIRCRKKVKLGIERRTTHIQNANLLYRVLPPPQSTLQVMWNFEELKPRETELYIQAILNRLTYRRKDVIQVLLNTHSMIQAEVQKSSANLRDVFRFKTLFNWFVDNVPLIAVEERLRTIRNVDFDFNYNIDRDQRAFILAVCFCYYMRLSDFDLRDKYLLMVEKLMEFEQGYMKLVMENEQTDYLCRMNKPPGIAMNLALRENVFACFVCLINRIPIIIVGMPGCSKSLSVKLLLSNLRGTSSEEDFFKTLPEVQMFYFQGSESCTSEGVEQVFQRAHRIVKNMDIDKMNSKTVPCILFDEIGLAEVSVHNPLKVLHSHLQTNNNQLSFIGISNWELDAAKMSRFLVISRPLPNQSDLTDTASKIFQSYDSTFSERFLSDIKALSNTYSIFIQKWKESKDIQFRDFFGMRDFYALVKDVCREIKQQQVKFNERHKIQVIIRRSVSKNFDGRPNSVQMFMEILSTHIPTLSSIQQQIEDSNELEQIRLALAETQSRCLLQIINDESVVFLVNHKLASRNTHRNVITIHGSTFQQDQHSEQYNLYVISDVINYVSRGDILVFKDVNNSIQTSLYDLFNKSFHRVGNRNFCRISVGANYNPKCFVHPSFNCLVYIRQAKLAEVDPPFLNRFQKHCLSIGGLLSIDEMYLINEMESWLQRLMHKVLKGDQLLKRENFLVNCSRETLASLAIKCLIRYPDSQEKQLELAKRTMLMNSTGDFELLVDSELIEFSEVEFIRCCISDKHNLKLVDAANLIVYTYDQRVEIASDNLLSLDGRTKSIRICEMNCEKDLRNELEDFYKSYIYETLQVKLNLATEGHHVCMLIFLIDKTAKKFSHIAEGSKRIHIIISTSRLHLVAGNTYKEISFINGYQQVFLDTLQRSHSHMTLMLMPRKINTLLQLYPQIGDARGKLNNIFYRAINHFEFSYQTLQQNRINKKIFWNILVSLPENDSFVQKSSQFMQEVLKKLSIDNWKEQILTNKQLALLSHTTFEAVERYFLGHFEDTLHFFIKHIVELDVIYQLNIEQSLQLVKFYSADAKQFLYPLLTRDKLRKMKLINALADSLLVGEGISSGKKAPRELGGERIVLRQPRMFPMVSQSFPALFKNSQTEESILSICTKELKESKGSMSRQAIDELHLKVQAVLLKDRFFATKLNDKELLTGLDQKEYLSLREVYMYELIKQYIQIILKEDVDLSKDFLEVFNLIVGVDSTFLERIVALFLNNNLWRVVFYIVKNLQEYKYFNVDSPIHQYLRVTLDTLCDKQTQIIKCLLKTCEERVKLEGNIIKNTGGCIQFIDAYDKHYKCIDVICNQYKHVKESSVTRLQHQLMLMLKEIDKVTAATILQKCLQNDQVSHFRALDTISVCLKNLISEERLYNFRSELLCQEYLNSDKTGDYSEHLLTSILKDLNQDQTHAKRCVPIIHQIVEYIRIELNCESTLDDLSDKYFESGLKIVGNFLKNNLASNLAVILSDYFYTALRKLLDQQQKQVRSLEDKRSQASQIFEWLKMGLQLIEQDKASSLQELFLVTYGKHAIELYINILEKSDELHPIDNEISNIINREMIMLDNFRLYGMKLLVNHLSFSEFRKKYIVINRLPWISRYAPQLLRQTNNNNSSSAVHPSQELRELFKQFLLSNNQKMDLLEAILNELPRSHQNRMACLEYFREHRQSIRENSQLTNEMINRLDRRLEKISSTMDLQLIKRYLSGDQFQLWPENDKHECLVSEFIFTVLNWTVATRYYRSPLTNILFRKNGDLIQRPADHINNQFLLAGPDSPIVVENAKIFQLLPKTHKIMTCTSKCSYFFSDLEPELPDKCPICNNNLKDPSIPPAMATAGILKPNKSPSLDNHYNRAIVQYLKRLIDKQSDQHLVMFRGDHYRLVGWLFKTNKLQRIMPLTQLSLECTVSCILFAAIILGWLSTEDCQIMWKANSVTILGNLRQNISKNVKELKEYYKDTEQLNQVFARIYKTSVQFKRLLQANIDQQRRNIDFAIRQLKQIAKTANKKEVSKIDSIVMEHSKAQKQLPSSQIDGPLTLFHRNIFQQFVEKAIYNIQEEPAVNLTVSQDESLQHIISRDFWNNKHLIYMRILRMTHHINLKHTLMQNQCIIKSQCPLLFTFLFKRDRLEHLFRLHTIVKFTEQIQNLVNFRLTRAIVGKLKLSEFLKQKVYLDNDKKQMLSRNAEECVTAWNKNSLFLSSSHSQLNLSSPLANFLIDPQNKILRKMYVQLAKLHNYILIQARQYSSNPNENVDEQKKVQNIPLENLAFLTVQEVQNIIKDNNMSETTLWKQIESILIERIRCKSKLTEDQNKLIQVEYAGQVQLQQRKYYNYLNSLRESVDENNQNLLKLKENLERLKYSHRTQFFYLAKMIRETLERILVNLHSLPDKGITIIQYHKRHNVRGTTPEAIEMLKEIKVEHTLNAYQTIQALIFDKIWETLDDKYRMPMSQELQNLVGRLLSQLKDKDLCKADNLPQLEILYNALNRAAVRCIGLNDIPEGTTLEELLKNRPDVWPCNYETGKIQNICRRLEKVQLMHSHALHELILAAIKQRTKPQKTVLNPQLNLDQKITTDPIGSKQPRQRKKKTKEYYE